MVAVDSLPWPALRLQDPAIPWPELRAMADAAVESAYVREQLIEKGEAELNRQVAADEYDASDLTDLGVAAVFAMAAERIEEAARRPIAEFLLRMLKRGSETGVDYLEEAAERAAGRLGPVIIEPLLRMIEAEGCQLHCWFPAFALLCVAEHADAPTRQHVARFCRRAVRECPDKFEAMSLTMGPAWVLQALDDRDSLPLLKAIYEQSQDAELLHVIQHFDRGRGAFAPHAWHVSAEDWLPGLVTALREACEEEKRARRASLVAQPADPVSDPEEDANYTTDWRQLLSGVPRPLDQERHTNQVPILRDEPKVGRNDPCPCGSGKKYKRCCGR